jgi:hypothetical protein
MNIRTSFFRLMTESHPVAQAGSGSFCLSAGIINMHYYTHIGLAYFSYPLSSLCNNSHNKNKIQTY